MEDEITEYCIILKCITADQMKYKTFATERLLIRPTTGDDAALMLELLNSPKWIEHIGDRNVNSIAEAKTYISEKITPQLLRLGYSNYTLITLVGNQKVGCCGLYDREGLDGIDIGFALLPEFEKLGYGFEAASEVIKAATTVFGVKVVRAITTKQNIDSQTLLEKLEMTYVKLIRIENDPEELMLYEFKAK